MVLVFYNFIFHFREVRLSIIQNVYYTCYERYNLLNSLTLEDLMDFGDKFLKELHIVSVIQGNVTQEHALSVMENILTEIQCQSISDVSIKFIIVFWCMFPIYS